MVDSGSTDGTVELARRYGAAVHGIDAAEFNHGATRNLGISLSRGKFVALVVQDALPLDGRWLAAMVEDLERDERVAGVYGRQISHPESGALTRVVVDNRPTASPERQEQFVPEGEEYAGLPPQTRWRLASFDNVSSCLRRSVWEELPFERTGFGEDLRWGKRVVEAGHKLVYEPRSTVLHSHERGALYELRRHYVNQLVLLELFGLRLVPNPGYLLLSIPRSFLYLCRLLYRDEKTFGGCSASRRRRRGTPSPRRRGHTWGERSPARRAEPPALRQAASVPQQKHLGVHIISRIARKATDGIRMRPTAPRQA